MENENVENNATSSQVVAKNNRKFPSFFIDKN
jgi:hypothetical protein